ncbi:hypothetical protein PR001_g28138, partial [Phytophthora rubi]
EEHASLEEVVRTARKAGAAKCKAAREEKKRSLSQDQPAAEPPVQNNAHQVSGDGEVGGESETGQGEPGLGEPEVASVGSVDEDESQVESRASDSPLPGQDVSVQAPAQDVSLSTVLEDVSGEDAEALVLLEGNAPPNVQLTTTVQKTAAPSSQRLSDDVAKAYVAKRVSRWEQVRSERVIPPLVQYDWPSSRPDSLPWFAATLATSKYMAARATLDDAIQACVAELNLDRRDLATAQDVVAAEIPVSIFSPRECVAVLQTLLFEAGFHFDNLVPVWFRMPQQVREELAKLTEQLATLKSTSPPEVNVQQVLAEAGIRAREAELRAQDAERRLIGLSAERAEAATQREDVAAVIQSACLQAANAERERVEAVAIQLLQQQQAEVDERREAEQAAWLQQAQKNLDEQQAAFQQRLEDERVTGRNMQRYQAEQIRNLQATSTPSRVSHATPPPNPTSQVKTERTDPKRATETGGVNMGERGATRPLDYASCWKYASPRKTDANAATLKTNVPQKTRTETPKADTKKNVKSERQPRSKKPDKKPPPPKKSKRGLPSGSSSSSSSNSNSSSDSSSSDSEDSMDEDLSTGVDASDATKVGGTLLTLRPYVSSSTLEKFDEKASMGDRRSWWERFVNMSVQGGWTDKMMISELKMKMSSAVRNWRGQLSKHVQNNWRRLSGEFKRKYLKARTSESERYYTMRQKSNESAMEFLYRLNEAAVKAGIRYKKGKKYSIHHIKRFSKN